MRSSPGISLSGARKPPQVQVRCKCGAMLVRLEASESVYPEGSPVTGRTRTEDGTCTVCHKAFKLHIVQEGS
jgi:hypothetical protein